MESRCGTPQITPALLPIAAETPMCSSQTSDTRHPVTLLCHPAVLLAVAACAVNDHLFKGSGWLPGVVTGKLSDVAGLFFFPVLLAVLLFLVARITGRLVPFIGKLRRFDQPRTYVDTATILTIAVFAALNVSPTANALLEPYWGVVTMDMTDLLCLPMVLVGRQFTLRRWRQPVASTTTRSLTWRHWGALAFAVVVSAATSPAPATVTIAGFPYWSVSPPVVHCHDDTEIRGWFAKSGREGTGFVLRLDRVIDEPTDIQVDVAQFLASTGEPSSEEWSVVVDGAPSPRSQVIDGGGAFYIPFEFDNEQALIAGKVKLSLRIGGQPYDLTFDSKHRSGAISDWYVGYERYGEPLWGSIPEEEGAFKTGPRRDGRPDGPFLVRRAAEPGVYGVRFDPQWSGGCGEAGNE